VDFGFSVPSGGPNATPEIITTLVRRGEELGFSYVGIPDHIVIPKNIESTYPYSEDGAFSGSGHILDQLTVASFIAGQTSKTRILTSVLVLPHRSAVLTAKMLASIDVLSNGRLTVGCGVGWLQEEFDAIGAPAFGKRGSFRMNTYPPSKSCGQVAILPSMANTSASQTSPLSPNRLKNRIPQSGSEEKAPPHFVELRSLVMDGTLSAPILVSPYKQLNSFPTPLTRYIDTQRIWVAISKNLIWLIVSRIVSLAPQNRSSKKYEHSKQQG